MDGVFQLHADRRPPPGMSIPHCRRGEHRPPFGVVRPSQVVERTRQVRRLDQTQCHEPARQVVRAQPGGALLGRPGRRHKGQLAVTGTSMPDLRQLNWPGHRCACHPLPPTCCRTGIEGGRGGLRAESTRQPHTVTATDGDATGTATLRMKTLVNHLVLTPPWATIITGASQTYTVIHCRPTNLMSPARFGLAPGPTADPERSNSRQQRGTAATAKGTPRARGHPPLVRSS